jgi:hypothetical protein
VYNVEYDQAKKEYLYTFKIDLYSSQPKLLVARLYEDQICDLCTALQFQISVLEREYDAAIALFENKCPHGVPPYQQQITYEDHKMRVHPPKPRFGYNEIVYLLETAQVVGRLESFHIFRIIWNNKVNQWNYIIKIYPRPEHHMTIGDADNRRHILEAVYAENELTTFCEAQDMVVQFLTQALSLARQRYSSLCHPSSGSST